MSIFKGMSDWSLDFKRKYGLKAFIETGCYMGDALKAARDLGFHPLYSCDINESFVESCRKNVPEAVVSCCSSTEFLKQVCSTIEDKALVWLDAHFSNFHGGKDTTQSDFFPVLEELQIIATTRVGDVILVDDTRVLADMGRQHEVPEHLRSKLALTELSDVIKITHSLDKSLFGYAEGVAIFLPR